MKFAQQLGPGPFMKRTWNLTTVFQIVQNIREDYCPCFYLSTG